MNDSERRTQCVEHYRRVLPCLSDYVTHWSRIRPRDAALIEHDTGAVVSWREFDRAVEAFAATLLACGLRKGDVVATSLPFVKEHVFLTYACFRTGVIIAPLDLRLKAIEINDAFARIRPKACFCLGNTPRADFRPIVREVMGANPECRLWVQFQADRDGVLPGAVHVRDFARDIKRRFIVSRLTGSVRRARRLVGPRDAALIIFTTGSTGTPKPALLCHENVLIQNIGQAVAFEMVPGDRMLVNMPPSHVGGQTEQLMTSLYAGASVVLLPVFDARTSLEAIQRHRVTGCGAIPAGLQMQWRVPDYASFDLSSLRMAIYGGQTVDKPFLDKLRAMATQIGTGDGLTEVAGFCTYTPGDWGPDEILQSIGFDSPLCPISIREPMNEDGTAGAVKPPGEVGDICFEGPQVFLGYLNDPEATRKTISLEGIIYTGDLGSYDHTGLHLASRRSFVIKPQGFLVFPGEVEQFITEAFKDRIATTCCVGVPHPVRSEAIVAFVELKPLATLDPGELDRKLLEIAAYKRPSHVVFVEEGALPLNRVLKVDVPAVRRMAEAEVATLAASGRWE